MKHGYELFCKFFFKKNPLPNNQSRRFLATPGVNEAIAYLKNVVSEEVLKETNRGPKETNSSNVFAPIESCLLKWATIHYDFMNPTNHAIITSFTQLTDACVLAVFIKSHVPRAPMDLISNPETEDDYEHNLKMMISNYESLHLKLN